MKEHQGSIFLGELKGSKIAETLFKSQILIEDDWRNTQFSSCTFLKCQLSQLKLEQLGACFQEASFKDTRFHQCNLRKADFSQATSYDINPMTNQLQKAIFSIPEVMSLLFHLDIVVH